MHLSGIAAMSVAAGFGTVFRIVTGWFDEMQNARILEEEKLRSELMLLKAQVNPHFLFNTLNNIDSLIHTRPGQRFRGPHQIIIPSEICNLRCCEG